MRAKFSRDLTTGDAGEDADLSGCLYFIFPYSGGPLIPGTTEVAKHANIPALSPKPICLRQCSAVQPQYPPLHCSKFQEVKY